MGGCSVVDDNPEPSARTIFVLVGGLEKFSAPLRRSVLFKCLRQTRRDRRRHLAIGLLFTGRLLYQAGLRGCQRGPRQLLRPLSRVM